MLEELEEELSLPSNAGDSNEGVKMKLYLCDHYLASICKTEQEWRKNSCSITSFHYE